MQNDIEAILATLTPEEKQAVLTIMNEQASTGSSSSLAELYNEDYEEVPVDIDTFLESPLYLGNSTNNGTAIYPYWRNCYREIIEQDKIEICMGGSIGCGKTTAAIYLMAYFFYKLMCLRNPRQYFGLEGNGPISIAFLNNTIQLSKGVAYDKFMTTISTSPWFLDRGEIRGTVNLRYKPEKNIEFVLGSSSDQIIGRDIFCLTGDTLVETAEGSMYLRDLENKSVYVKTLDNDGNIITSEKPCRIVKTKLVAAVRMILLQDKSTLSCTYNHRFLMADMSYKEAKEITRGDRLYSPTSENGMLVVGTNMATYQKSIPVYDVLDVEPYHNFLVNTGKNLVVSHNCAIQDECNFSKNADIHLEKNKVLETYNACFGRIKNRFTINGRCQGRIFLVSSKKTEYDFLNQFVEKKMKSKVDAPNLYVADAKAFEVKPKGSYSGKMFRVAVGGANLPSKIPEDDETTEELIHQGYEVHEAPIELRGDFELDINRYIADHLGISVSEVIKFIPYIKLEKCYKDIQNPVSHEVVLANLSDKIPVETYFKPQIVPESIYRKPIFIHIDTSGGKTDNTGISAVACMGFVNRNRYSEESGKEETTKQMLYRHVFSLGLNAEKHTEISFQKLVDFLWYLKYKLGWNIKAVSTDGYMGQFLRQQIAAAGFQEVNYVSLDRTPEGYLALQSILAEERIALIKLNLLETELVRLERNNISGRIDHPIDGCFTGDTKVSLVDGRELTMLELKSEFESGRVNYVYTCNEDTHQIEPKPIINVFWTKRSSIVEIELDNGEVIRCTPDHRFLNREGNYVEAQCLGVGDSLMPLYRKISSKGLDGYRLFYNPADNQWHYEHRSFCGKALKAGYVIHHVNFNKLDNTPTNLAQITKSAHRGIHNRHQSASERRKRSDSVRAWHANMRGTAEYESRREACRSSVNNYYAAQGKTSNQEQRELHIREIEEAFGVKWETLTDSEKNSYGNKLARMKDPTITERISASLSARHAEGRFKNAAAALKAHNEAVKGVPRSAETKSKISEKAKGRIISEETRKKISESSKLHQRRWYTDGVSSILLSQFEDVPEGFEPGRIMKRRNHKVVAVRFVDTIEDVYDITVADTPNFALNAGVFVHNSKDIADSLAGALYNATLHEKDLQLGNEELLDMIVDANPRSVPSGNYKQQESAAVSADEVKKILDQIKETQPKFSDANARKVAARQALINKMQEEDWENSYQDMNDGFLI